MENQRQNEIAKAQSVLQTSKTEYERNVKIARIEADKAAAVRDAELQKDVEMKRALVEQEKLRADTFAKAKIGAESTVTEADAALYKAQKEADAKLYQQEKSAQGIRAVYEAQASGIASLTSAFGGSSQVALQYLMLEKGLYQELAASNAEAIRGLNPKITVWNTGSGDHGGSDSFKAVRDVFQALPPLLTTINDQTGVAPPAWLAQLPPTSTTSNAPVSSLTSEK